MHFANMKLQKHEKQMLMSDRLIIALFNYFMCMYVLGLTFTYLSLESQAKLVCSLSGVAEPHIWHSAWPPPLPCMLSSHVCLNMEQSDHVTAAIYCPKTCYTHVCSTMWFFWHSPIRNQKKEFSFRLLLPIISYFLSFNYVVVTSLCTWQLFELWFFSPPSAPVLLFQVHAQ